MTRLIAITCGACALLVGLFAGPANYPGDDGTAPKNPNNGTNTAPDFH